MPRGIAAIVELLGELAEVGDESDVEQVAEEGVVADEPDVGSAAEKGVGGAADEGVSPKSGVGQYWQSD